MKISIWYFSGTGNTWFAAEEIAAALRSRSAETEVYSIEQCSDVQVESSLASADIIGFGYPVYGSDLPLIMKKFLQALPRRTNSVPVFLFCTQWLFSGDGTWAAMEFLPQGYEVRWSSHFRMPNNICINLIRLPFTNDSEKIRNAVKKNIPAIHRFAEHIIQNKPKKRGFTRISTVLGQMQRSPFRRLYDRLRDDIGIDDSRCIHCGLCAQICPVSNLVSDENGSVAARGACILCFRCYNFCPRQAITYMGRSHILSRGVPYRGPAGYNPAGKL